MLLATRIVRLCICRQRDHILLQVAAEISQMPLMVRAVAILPKTETAILPAVRQGVGERLPAAPVLGVPVVRVALPEVLEMVRFLIGLFFRPTKLDFTTEVTVERQLLAAVASEETDTTAAAAVVVDGLILTSNLLLVAAVLVLLPVLALPLSIPEAKRPAFRATPPTQIAPRMLEIKATLVPSF
jgi:hypothetical protein